MVERIRSGVEGLDRLVEGGFLRGDVILLAGNTGSGKTIFSMEFICKGATQYGEKGVFVTFEEDAETLKRNILELGFDLEKLEREGLIRVLDLEAIKGSGLSANIDFILDALREMKAKRLVIDSLTAFLIACQEKFEYRTLMHLFYKILKKLGCTSIMTCSVPTGLSTLGLGIEEFIADSVITLENTVRDGQLKTRFLIRKMRGTSHSKKYHEVVIDRKGLKIVPFSMM
ncbi:MAG: AAA family ATPase [Candidatus Bathyarchaeota archaeon]|nr:AAA family ATPase [Candidatus Bathyarchaeota archaeon]MDH5532502.1 AAA family ATPase [Candidatus Bathyarchaeota archaeon]MDH5713422.1 AAA family ATPase [Candidatus Bathyarchaeota archaeon]